MSHLITKVTSHRDKIKSLYKRSLVLLLAYTGRREMYLFEKEFIRAEFDKHINEKDAIKVQQLIEAAEHELFLRQRTYVPYIYPDSPGGVAYDRHDGQCTDNLLDFWHPLEKALYPSYFATREKRKLEYIEAWHKQYNIPKPAPGAKVPALPE